MRTLQFKVSGQKLEKTGDFNNIVAGSKQYLQCKFVFTDADWIGITKVAVFNSAYPEKLNSMNACSIPDKVTNGRKISVRLIGKKGDKRITTNSVSIVQVTLNDL